MVSPSVHGLNLLAGSAFRLFTLSCLAGLCCPVGAEAQVRYAPRRPASSTSSPALQGKPPAVQKTSATSTHPREAQIVAVVNQEQITRTELARECIRRFGEQVLEAEVNKRLILEACQAHSIQVTPEEIESEIARMAGKFGLSVDRWLMMLREERGISDTQYRRDIIWPMLCLRKLAAGSLEVTPEELQQAFESEYGESVQVRMIASKSKTRAQQLHAKATELPDRFDKLAKDYSEDENSAAARGLIPPIRRHVGDPEIERIVFSLQEGEISPIVEAGGEWFIFKCERRLPARELDAQQSQQLRDQLQEQLRDKKLQSAGSKLFQQLQSQAKIVNVYNDPELRKQMPDVAALINDRPISLATLGEQCVLRYGHEVLQAEIHRRLLRQALAKRSLEVTEADLQAEIARAAEAYGFVTDDGRVDVKRWLEHITQESTVSVDTYVRDAVWPSSALKKLVDSTVEVTQEDLQKGFEANYGERVEVLAIVLSNQRTAHEVFELARQNPTDKFFGELAHQYSIEPVSRANFGQVPPIRRWGGQPLIEKEAFALQPGEISGVLATGDKFVLLRCLGRTRPVVPEMSQVQDELERDIREKKLRLAMAHELERIRKTAQIDNFLEKTTQIGAQGQTSHVSPATHQVDQHSTKRR